MSLLLLSLMAVNGPGVPSEPLYSLSEEWNFAQPITTPVMQPVLQDEEGSPFSYTYLEFGGRQLDVDAADDEADVFYFEGALQLGMFYLIGGYENTSIDFDDADADLLRLGAGLHFNMTPKLDLFGDAQWLYNDVSSNSLDDSESGFQFRAGPRWMPLDWNNGGLEINGELRWLDLENRIGSDDEVFGWGLGARAHFLTLFSVGLNYLDLDDDDEIALNARVSF